MSLFLLAVAVDVTELAMQGVLCELLLLHADDLVLISKTFWAATNKFRIWKDAFRKEFESQPCENNSDCQRSHCK